MENRSGIGRAGLARPDRATVRAEIVSLVADRLEGVEETFRENLASPTRIIDEIGAFVAQGRGKRIRPTLHLLCTRLCGYTGPHDVLLATVLEFIHCATLIHDDILDDATTRRGMPSVNHKWGNSITVLFGDYILAKAMEMALQAGSLRVMQKLADVTLRMTEGEMLQTRYLGRLDLTVDEYLDLVEKKTASLFACCCELAGILAGVGKEQETALHRYGAHLGLAFQLVDDLLDLTGDPRVLGKPTANDLREGKTTLAVLDLLASGSSEGRRVVQRVMSGNGSQGTDSTRLVELLSESGAIERSQKLAASHAARAVAELEHFKDSSAKRAMHALPELIVDRDR